MRSRTTSIAAAALITLAWTATADTSPYAYDGAGVVVTAIDNEGTPITVLDNGAVVCSGTTGVGGVCIPFTEFPQDVDGAFLIDSIHLVDADDAIDSVFQVCVDLNGDGVCGGRANRGNICEGDLVVFSHSTAEGLNFNPLFVNPAGALSLFESCDSAGYPGYIVITCAGLHAHTGAAASTHTHHVTQGTATPMFTGGTPSGDFCGGAAAPAKAYRYEE